MSSAQRARERRGTAVKIDTRIQPRGNNSANLPFFNASRPWVGTRNKECDANVVLMSFCEYQPEQHMIRLPRSRRAFTLIELLVVIAVITVLMAMLLPAIQKVRAAADRMICASNLKQMGIALHHFHGDYRRFPPGYSANASYLDGQSDTSPGWGWGSYLLPYLEEDAVYRTLAFNLPVEHPANAAAVKSRIKMFLCPSDEVPPTSFLITTPANNPLVSVGPSSYAATCGPDDSETTAETGLGVFYRNSKTRFADVPDGVSYTIFLGDRAWNQTHGTWVGAPANGVVRAGDRNKWPFATAGAPVFVLVHNNWLNIETDADGGLDDFSSNHVNGANFLFGDGSVHFIQSVTIDGQRRYDFWALGTRNGGEVLVELDYD
jgi:prepilin-type N-terminal cleavage/methylation domain-containing protein/prepilin-type processing-associated H-X9-DG protein